MNLLRLVREQLPGLELQRRVGRVRAVRGLAVEATGPAAAVGQWCRILPAPQAGDTASGGVLAEVVGVAGHRLTLMPSGLAHGIRVGDEVQALGLHADIAVGPALLGRVIDGFGEPLDGLPPPRCGERRPLQAPAPSPLLRPRIDQVLETGVRAIDGLLTLGRGQRVGIFAGSGVGKSTLLGMIARHVDADVNVIALVGERGREVREFVEQQLGPQALQRSVVVAATSGQSASARLRAAHAAVAIAGHFAQAGRHVLLTMDSVTRLAMARRELGLAAGEPATARGFTPSVFAELPPLCERCGTTPEGGSVSALFTVLVEGDDFNEPVSDHLRALLDGHIVLSRELAQQAHFPSIDVLRSASRLMPQLITGDELARAQTVVRQLALLERHRQMVDLGAYVRGSNPALDAALVLEPRLQAWLRQAEGGVPRRQALEALATTGVATADVADAAGLCGSTP